MYYSVLREIRAQSPKEKKSIHVQCCFAQKNKGTATSTMLSYKVKLGVSSVLSNKGPQKSLQVWGCLVKRGEATGVVLCYEERQRRKLERVK